MADRAQVFLSYGHKDATKLALKLHERLIAAGYGVWQDVEGIRAGHPWDEEIRAGIQSSDLLLAILTPHAVRSGVASGSGDGKTSVCLEEIAYARDLPIPIVPVLAFDCEVPFLISRLQYVDLRRWRESDSQREALFATVTKAVADFLRGEEWLRDWWSLPEPWDFTAFLGERRRDFHGRDWLFAEIEEWLAEGRQPALLVVGDPGVGKSAFVAEWVHRNPGGRVLAYHCCQWDSDETLDAGRFVQSIAAMIGTRLPAYAEMLNHKKLRAALEDAEVSKAPGSAFETAILNPLAKLPAPAQGTCLILIDAFDEGVATSGPISIPELLASRLRRLPKWLKIVATTRDDRSVLDRFGAAHMLRWSIGDDDNLRDLDSYVRDSLEARDDLQAQVLGICQGSFLVARTLLDALEAGQLDADQLEKLPPELGSVWSVFFERLFERADVDFEPSRRLLEVVAASRRPQSRPDLAAATGLDAEEELPALLERLAPFLPFSEGTYRMHHRSLFDWLTGWDSKRDRSLAGPYHLLLSRGHERWADLGWGRYEKGPERVSDYDLEFLPVHLVGAERWEELGRLMEDERFLDRQLRGFPLRPQLPLITVHGVLRGAIADDDAVRVLDILSNHAPRIANRIRSQSPIEALREGNLERAEKLADLYESEDRALQLLMLAWELEETGRSEDAEQVLQRLGDAQAGELSLIHASIAVAVLTRLSSAHLEQVRDLQGKILSSRDREKLLDALVAADHGETALELSETVEFRARVLASLAAREAEASHLESAMETLERIVTADPGAKSNPQSPVWPLYCWALTQYAAAHARKGDVEEARRWLSGVAPAYVPEAVASVGLALCESGHSDEARGLFREALEAWKNTSQFNRQMLLREIGPAQARAGFLDDARESMSDPDASDDRETIGVAMAEALAQREKYEDALAELSKLEREKVRGHVLVATASALKDDLDRTLAIAQAAGPKDERDVLCDLVTELLKQGRIAQAEKVAGGIKWSSLEGTPLREVAEAWAKAGDLDAANRCLARIPSGYFRYTGQLGIAFGLLEFGRGSDARALVAVTRRDESDESQTQREELREQVARLQIRAGLMPEAEATAESIRGLLRRTDVWRTLARELHERGQRDAALAWWRRIGEAAPETPKGGKMVWAALGVDQMRCAESDLALESIGQIADPTARVYYLCDAATKAQGARRPVDALRALRMARELLANMDIDQLPMRQHYLTEIIPTLVELGDDGEATAAAEVPSSECQRGALYAVVASAQARVGRLEQARQSLARASKALGPLSRILLAYTDPKIFLEMNQQITELNSDPELDGSCMVAIGRASCLLAEAQVRLGEEEDAKRTLALLRSQKDEALLAVGRALAQSERTEESEAAFVGAREVILEKSTFDLGGKLSAILQAQIEFGSWDRAMETCRLAEAKMNASELWTTLGAALYRAGQENQAREAFGHAFELAHDEASGEDRARLLSRLAVAEVEAGLIPEALRSATAIDSGRAECLPPVLAALQEAGEDDAFVELLGACLPDAECSLRIRPLILARYPEQIEHTAGWVAELGG